LPFLFPLPKVRETGKAFSSGENRCQRLACLLAIGKGGVPLCGGRQS